MGTPVALFFCFVLFAMQSIIISYFTKDPEVAYYMQRSFAVATISLFFDFFQQF